MSFLSPEHIGLFIWGLIASIGWIKKNIKSNKKEKEFKENIYQAKTWIFKEIYDLQRFSELERYIKQVFTKTNMNRFTILISMNGKIEYNFISVLFDQKLGDTNIGSKSIYDHIETDEVYKKMLKRLENVKFIWDADFGNYGIMQQYSETEGIKEHMWGFVERINLDKYDDVYLYVAFTSEECCSSKKDRDYIELVLNGRIIPKIKEIVSV